ncbi:MAG: hypothetical protein KGQ66_21735 [Acidobacteriota bacterium]|nr:hypothetical protein [Acidobacteriota bacterium]
MRRLVDSIDAAAATVPFQPRMGVKEVRRLVSEVLGADSDLARHKVFFRRDVIVAVAPTSTAKIPAWWKPWPTGSWPTPRRCR